MKNKKEAPIWGFFFLRMQFILLPAVRVSEIYFAISSCSARFRIQMKSETARLC